MKILGIETSCDETSAAVVEDGTRVLSNIIASQIPMHVMTGGVVPEVAAREHVLKIVPVVYEALEKADVKLNEIDAIAVTQGPGLLSSLVIGVTAASTLAIAAGKPLIPVNHIAGHIYANWLGEDALNPIQFPLIVLTVSGGHNELVLMKSHASFTLLGETRDDAAGEAFDKVARLLGLGYPGGPQISRVALMGNPLRYDLPQARLRPIPKIASQLKDRSISSRFVASELPYSRYGSSSRLAGRTSRHSFEEAIFRMGLSKTSLDFSFSGLKTAVLNLVTKEHREQGELSDEFKADCAASFQEAVCHVLSDKLLLAAELHKVREVHLAGGVSANRRLRAMVEEKVVHPILRYPKDISYCTDNAAMIASTAYFHFQKSPKKYVPHLNALADPSLRMYG